MNSIEGQFHTIKSLLYPIRSLEEITKEEYESPLKSTLNKKSIKQYIISPDDKSAMSGNSSEKIQNDQNLQKCLLNALLLRLDQCSPATAKGVPEDDLKYFDSFVSPFSKRLDFNNVEYYKKPFESNNSSPTAQHMITQYDLVNLKKKTKNKTTAAKSFKNKKNSKKKKKPFCERQCDWKCYYCNNLNFGFRQLCNRCHQSRDETKNNFD